MPHSPFPSQVKLVEVSPRDGLQNESSWIPTEIKLTFIEQLAQAGLSAIEATSFSSEKWVPTLSDHTAVMKKLAGSSSIQYIALVPTIQTLHEAMDSHCKHISVITAVSDTFSQKNANANVAESMHRIQEIVPVAKKNNLTVRAYISCALGCPYEGFIAPEKSAQLALRLHEMGCDEIALADTIGVGTPFQAQQLIRAASQTVPINKLAIHFHDTYGQALANIYACLELGISTIDASVGGLGGCPYAKGASGNVATEDVVYLLNGLGIKTGVDLNALISASEFIHAHLPRKTRSKVGAALQARIQNDASKTQ